MEERIEKDCPFCGEKILIQAKKCKFCNEIVDPDLRELRDLKSNSKPKAVPVNVSADNIAEASEDLLSDKSHTAYLILGILLGHLGIHNFYAGYTEKAVAQLLISILLCWLIFPPFGVWIWAIIEVCTVEKDADGKKFK